MFLMLVSVTLSAGGVLRPRRCSCPSPGWHSAGPLLETAGHTLTLTVWKTQFSPACFLSLVLVITADGFSWLVGDVEETAVQAGPIRPGVPATQTS